MNINESGGPEKPASVHDDLSLIEQALERERYLMVALMDHVPDHIYFKDIEGRFIRNNMAHAVSFGLKDPSEMVGRTDFDFFMEDVARQQYNDEQEIIRTGLSMNKEERTIRSDGSVNWYSTTKMPLREKNGKIVGTFGISRDITRRKATEIELIKLSKAVEQSPVSIIITDPDGDIEYVNPKACETTGYSQKELLGQNPRVLKSGETKAEEYSSLWDSIQAGNQWKGLFHNKKKNGKLYWESATIAPIRDNAGNITHFLAVKEDITEQLAVENALRESEAQLRLKNEELVRINAEKDKFFSIIAHDLRSPFNSFLNLTEMMADEVHEMNQEKIRKLATSMNRSAGALYALLENLLDWSRMKRGLTGFEPEQIRLNDIVNSIIHLTAGMAVHKQIGVNVLIPGELEVYADKQMLGTTLRNLTTNAIKFTKEGGQVMISAKVSAEGDSVLISVRDTGIGMDQSRLSRLFRINEDVSRKGTGGESSSGLGLLLCKEFVEKNGGKIWAESEENKGSSFRFTVPVAVNV
ncbi:MAG: PAS domain S-box protein [Bacteroidota bacterium]